MLTFHATGAPVTVLQFPPGGTTQQVTLGEIGPEPTVGSYPALQRGNARRRRASPTSYGPSDPALLTVRWISLILAANPQDTLLECDRWFAPRFVLYFRDVRPGIVNVQLFRNRILNILKSNLSV